MRSAADQNDTQSFFIPFGWKYKISRPVIRTIPVASQPIYADLEPDINIYNNLLRCLFSSVDHNVRKASILNVCYSTELLLNRIRFSLWGPGVVHLSWPSPLTLAEGGMRKSIISPLGMSLTGSAVWRSSLSHCLASNFI